MASHRERKMEKTEKFQIVYAALVKPLSTFSDTTSQTDLAIGIMRNESKQSALSKARSFKHSKTTSSFIVFNLSPTSR